MISVVLPIRCGPNTAYLVERLAANLTFFGSDPDVECIVVDSASPPPFAARIRALCDRPRCTLVVDPSPQYPFAPGATRNAGARRASGDWLYFHDVDLCVGPGFLDRLREAIATGAGSGDDHFVIIPCLFLTEQATRKITFAGGPVDLAPLLESFLAGESDGVVNLAATHTVVPRARFLALGGYHTDYRGHGGEDFDLVHRLASFRPLGRRASDYYEDIRTRFVADYRGFRAYQLQYALPHLFEGLFTAHLWHPRTIRRSYFRRRNQNEALLQTLMRQHDGGARIPPLPGAPHAPLPAPWIKEGTTPAPNARALAETELERHGMSPSTHPGLLWFRDGVKPIDSGLRRKLRKLVMRPGEFFADSRLLRFARRLHRRR